MDADPTTVLEAVQDQPPLVDAITNRVTITDVANIIQYVGGLPVMADDRREVAAMIESADACLLNTGDVSPTGEETMRKAGSAANEAGVPVVLDPVAVGTTPTRSRVIDHLLETVEMAIIKGNYGEISALADREAGLRGVEAVGTYETIEETAMAVADQTETVVVASGETDIVATPTTAYKVSVGDPMLGDFVGSGCMLGGTLAVFAGAVPDQPEAAALTGTVLYGLAAEDAAEGGQYAGPESYKTAFLDHIAQATPEDIAGRTATRIEAV